MKVGLESSGPIAVLSLAFVTGLGWRQSANKVRNTPTLKSLLSCAFQSLGKFLTTSNREVDISCRFPHVLMVLTQQDEEVTRYYRALWEVFQPALFVLIGAEIDVRMTTSRSTCVLLIHSNCNIDELKG